MWSSVAAEAENCSVRCADFLVCAQVAVREAKRQNTAYRLHSIPTLGRIAAAMTDRDMTDAVFGIVEPLLKELVTADTDAGDAMEIDGAGSDGSEKL